MRSQRTAIGLVIACVGALVTSAPAASPVVKTTEVLDHVTACTGENVLVEGVLQIHSTFVADSSGGEHFTNFTSFHGSGYTADGTRFRLFTVGRGTNNYNGAASDEEFGPQPEDAAAWIGSAVQPIIGIRQGEAVPDDDLHFLAVFHYTLTPDGRLTASIETFESECR